MLKHQLTFILFALTFTSCVTTSNIPTEVSSEIPDDANAIEVYSNESSSDFYKTIYISLQKDLAFHKKIAKWVRFLLDWVQRSWTRNNFKN